MKRNSLIVLGLTAALGAAIFCSQQGPTESVTHDLDKVTVISTTAEKQTQTSSFVQKVDDAANRHTDKDGEVVAPKTREEAINAARLNAIKNSGLDKRIAERKRAVTAWLDEMRVKQTGKMGHNENVKRQLNIDVKERFGVDFDTRMAEVQVQRQRKDSVELEKRLRAMGVGPEQIEEITAMRNLVLDVDNNSQ